MNTPQQGDDVLAQLKELAIAVQDDEALDESVRTELAELVDSVIEDPTPGNLNVLATTLEHLGDSMRYIRYIEAVSR